MTKNIDNMSLRILKKKEQIHTHQNHEFHDKHKVGRKTDMDKELMTQCQQHDLDSKLFCPIQCQMVVLHISRPHKLYFHQFVNVFVMDFIPFQLCLVCQKYCLDAIMATQQGKQAHTHVVLS